MFNQIYLFFVTLVLLCIISVGLFSYIKSSSLLETEVENSSISSLNQVKEIVDSKFMSYDGLTELIFLENNVSSIYYKSGKRSIDYQLFANVIAYLDSIKTTDNFFSEIWIYFNKLDYFVSTTTVHKSNIFYNSIINSNDILMKDITENNDYKLKYNGKYSINLGTGSKEVLSFIKAINYDSIEPRATITYNIDPVAIYGMIENLKNEYNHDVFIIDELGEIVLYTESNNEKSIKQYNEKVLLDMLPRDYSKATGIIFYEDYSITYSYSDITQWTYVSIQPIVNIRENSNIIRQFTFSVSMVVLLIALMFSYLLTKKIYAPIKGILGYISLLPNSNLDTGKNVYEFTLIKRIINFVYEENVDLKKIMRRNSIEKALDRLTSGDLSYFQIKDKKIKEIDFIYKKFIVVIYELSESNKNIEILPVDFENQLEKVSEGEGFITSNIYTFKKGEKYISIINYDDELYDDQGLSEYIEASKECIGKHFYSNVTVGVGKNYMKPDSINDSYKEAILALQYKRVKGLGNVIYVEEAYTFPGKLIDYSLEQETRLMNLTKSKETEKVKMLIEKIIDNNLLTNKPDVNRMNNLFNYLIGTAIRIIFDIQCTIEDVMGEKCVISDEIVKREELDDKKQYIIEEVYMNIIKYITSHRKNKYEEVF